MMNERGHLFASVLLDPPGSRTSRQLGKVQASSLLRTLFPGEMVVWRNFPEPLYPVERKGVHEVDFVPDRPLRNEELEDLRREAKGQMARSLVSHASRYEWIILADAGVMALRNWDHLFERSEAEVLVARRRERLKMTWPKCCRRVGSWCGSLSAGRWCGLLTMAWGCGRSWKRRWWWWMEGSRGSGPRRPLRCT